MVTTGGTDERVAGVADDTMRLSEAQTVRVVSSGPEVLQLESTWAPGPNRPPKHWHPRQVEFFEVLAGELTVELGDLPPRVLQEGEVLDIPARTPHRMWNAGPAEARALWRVTPALRTEEMFRFMSGGTGGLRGLRLAWAFRDEFRLGSIMGGP